MSDVLGVHVTESVENLSAEVLDVWHWQWSFRLAQYVFHATLTVLHHDVLDKAPRTV